MNTTKIQGTIKWYSSSLGHGIIETQVTDSIFVHYTEFESFSVSELVNRGDIVNFDLIKTLQGLEAHNVEIVRGGQ